MVRRKLVKFSLKILFEFFRHSTAAENQCGRPFQVFDKNDERPITFTALDRRSHIYNNFQSIASLKTKTCETILMIRSIVLFLCELLSFAELLVEVV